MLPVLSRRNVIVPLSRSWEKPSLLRSFLTTTDKRKLVWLKHELMCTPLLHIPCCFLLLLTHPFFLKQRSGIVYSFTGCQRVQLLDIRCKQTSFTAISTIKSPKFYIVMTFMDNLFLSLQFVNNNWYFKNRRSSWLSSVSSHGISMSNVFGVSGANKLWSSLLSGLEQSE